MSLHGNDVCLLEVEDYNLYEEEASDHAFSSNEKHLPPGSKTMEAEKRIRREIANSNERRRMQSINAGFQALRTLLPRHEGEKLSKAAILQQTAEYIYSLEQEKTRLLSQNCQLKRLLNQHEGGEVPPKKRKAEILSHIHIPDSTDDTVPSSRSPEQVAVITVTNVKKEVDSGELRLQLDRERRLRRLLEERLRALETRMYPDASEDLTITGVQYEQTELTECKVESEEIEEVPEEAVIPAAVALAVPTLAAPALAVPTLAVPAPAPPALAAPALAPPALAAPALTAPAKPAAPLLEAAIKAEPRVAVELLPDAAHDAASRLYLASTSRQNLETIVEAIRHLEGDHLFGEEAGDAPLALTKKAPAPRPGVIVVKHS